MARGFQQHILIGNLGQDPDTRTIQTRGGDERTVTNFSLAVNETNSDGSEVVTWYRVAAWNGLGETCAQYLTQGRRVQVVGTRLKASAWLDEDGNARAGLELTADSVLFLDGPRAEEAQDEPDPAPRTSRRPAQGNGRARQATPQGRTAQAQSRRRAANAEIPF